MTRPKYPLQACRDSYIRMVHGKVAGADGSGSGTSRDQSSCESELGKRELKLPRRRYECPNFDKANKASDSKDKKRRLGVRFGYEWSLVLRMCFVC